MKNKICNLICLTLVLSIFPLLVDAQSGKDLEIISESNKVALVIGNSSYKNGFSSLNSPTNDATKMAEALKRLGFSLVGNKAHLNATHREMDSLVDKFTEEIKRGGVGFFYFSGHGSQDNKRDNYLIPVDTSIKYQNDLKHLALKVEFVTSRMEAAENRLNILVLDACRNNPLPSGYKSGNNGLNTYGKIPSGVYIAYAARDGQTALDGQINGLSLYTNELLKNIETPNMRLEDIFINTRVGVKSQTNNQQYPMDYGSLDGRFYFKFDNNGNNSNNLNNNSSQIKESEKYFELGWKCAKSDYDCQILNFTKVIKLSPNNEIAYLVRGVAHLNKGNSDQALKDYSKAIEIDPKYIDAYYFRGSIYKSNNNFDQAIEDFTKFIKLNPDDVDVYYNRGYCYFRKKQYNQAIQDFTKSIKMDSINVTYYRLRGMSYNEIGETEKALADSKKAKQLEEQF